MRRLVSTAGAFAALSAVALSGCAPAAPSQQQASGSNVATPSSSPAAQVPPAPEPAAAGPCPYLPTAWVARTNGQRVSKVRVSTGEPPACFFYTLSGKRQLMVRVYTGKPAVATAIVNDAAPIERSNPASQPAGWKGGYLSTEEGAVYAVAGDGTAVVVTTNQQQSVKAREVVERTISSLGL